jgi:hypothetical protein
VRTRLVALAALCVVALLAATGCIYAHVRMPLDTDVARTTLGDKVGEASYQSVLWAVAWGDAGTKAAADNGGITTVTHLDQESLIVLLGLYAKRTTIAYGE